MVTDSTLLFFNEGISFTLREKKKIRRWIYASMNLEKKVVGSINFIFCSDDYLLEINKKYLQHNTFTDIITFDSSEVDSHLSGDIFISIDRVKENAKHFRARFVNELHRVMIHGMLHLAGYKDKDEEQKKLMRSKEDYYLSLQPEFFSK